jgi:general secretion pathway protein D
MDDSQGNQNQNNNNNQGNQGSAGEYMPWWSRATRGRLEEEPISNVIGRVRFIPDPRSKSILVLAPPEFQDSLEKTIKELDTPGKQVLIKAVVVEVDHSSMTSLGVQLATNPDAFGSLEENAITALGNLTSLATRGSARPADTVLGADGSGTIVGGTTAVYALLDFLIKTTDAKILNQQTLWTEDNEEAMFFKGEEVAFLAGATTSASVGVTQDVDFRDVGMTLQVRPSITPEKRVDMRVRVDLSQLTAQLVNSQPVTSKVETETNMIVRDGETIMLGGMLFQKDTLVNRKLPLLGDLPLVGGLFQHNDAVQSNNELILFVTPFVIDDAQALSEATKQQIEIPKQRFDEIQGELDETRRKLEGEPVSTLPDYGHSFLTPYARRSPSSGAVRQPAGHESAMAKW